MNTVMMRAGRLFVVAVFCASALAQAQGLLQGRVSLSYQGTPAPAVFEAFAHILGLQLRLDPAVTGAVTLDVRNVTADTALRAICESIGCRWRVDAGSLQIDRDPAAVAPTQGDPYGSIRLRDVYEEIPLQILWSAAPLDGTLKTLARMLGAELSLDRALSGRRVTLNLNHDTPREALNAICRQAGCLWRVADGQTRVLRVTAMPPPGSAAPRNPLLDFAPGVARQKDPGVTPPKLRSSAKPRYTHAAMQERIQGEVVLDCLVDADGTVGDVRIVTSLDQAHGLDDEAIRAAKLYLFEPATRAGKPIPVVVTLEMSFSLR